MTMQPIQTETPEVKALTSEAQGLVEMAQSLTVTAETVNEASDILSWIATNKKRLEAQRVSFVQPINKQVAFINGEFKDRMAPLETADKLVRGKMLTFQREQARIANEARAAEEKRIREEEAQRAVAAEKTGEPLEPAAPMPVASMPAMPERSTRSALGTTTVRKVWTFKIEDVTAIPREYLAVDEKKIGAVVRAGVRSIPGVRIYEEDQLAVRSR